MSFRNNHCVFLLLVSVLFFKVFHCEVKDSLYRQSRSDNGATYNLLSDGKVVVLTFVDASGAVLECAVIKDNSTIPKELFKEVVASNSKENLHFQSLKVDARKLGRKCTKYVRDMKRKKYENISLNEKVFLERLQLDEPLPGTRWCARGGRPHYYRGNVSKPALNACCKEFHTNPDVIPPFTFRHHHFNSLPWPISSCESSRTFQKCLEDEGSPQSTKFLEAIFDLLKLPCYELVEREICSEYSSWYDACKIKENVKVAVEKNINHIQITK